MRIDADYSADLVFTREGAAEEVAVAREFVSAARTLLSRGNWLWNPFRTGVGEARRVLN